MIKTNLIAIAFLPVMLGVTSFLPVQAEGLQPVQEQQQAEAPNAAETQQVEVPKQAEESKQFEAEQQTAESQQAETTPPVFKDDVIARVGDQSISFSQLNTMLNSSAIVGLSIPELGSPERDQVRLTLLDRVISANLLYLDALQQGVDRDPEYQRDLETFSEGMLALVYKRRNKVGQVDVTDAEVETYFRDNIVEGTELTDETRLAIAAKLRDQKLGLGATDMRARLRDGVSVVINVTELDPEDDVVRDDAEVVAEIDGQPLRWGQVKVPLSAGGGTASVERRIGKLDELIDYRIMTSKARATGLDQDPAYLNAFNEYKKVRLINLHRGNLVKTLSPSDQEVRDYYAEHRDAIMIPARRKLQIVVLKNREDAEAIKQMVESGTITMYQAAQDHSIIPASDKTLGEIGWVTEGTGFPELDKLAFSLAPGELGGPVQTPNGWHLVQVQDMEEAIYADPDEERTRRMTRRRMIKERLNEYVVGLREKDIPVEVYSDRLSYHMQKEIDWYQIKSETGTQSPEKVYEEIEKLRGGNAPIIGGK